jgi:hypothetical protein
MKSHFSGQTYGKNWPIKKNTAPKLGYDSCMAHLCRATEKNFVEGVWHKTGVINNNIPGMHGNYGNTIRNIWQTTWDRLKEQLWRIHGTFWEQHK